MAQDSLSALGSTSHFVCYPRLKAKAHMATTKKERVISKCEQSRTKTEHDPDLKRAMSLSLEGAKQVKAEQPIKTKVELRTGVKTERHSNVKPEIGAAAAAPTTAEQLPPIRAKIEQLRKVGLMKTKSELLKNANENEGNSNGIDKFVARGLQLRRQEQRVKREGGARGKSSGIKVKKERARNLNGNLRKKPRVTAKRRKASREAMAREIALSAELGDILGASALSRPETVRRLWAYCRDNDMLNPENKREICFNQDLENMFGK